MPTHPKSIHKITDFIAKDTKIRSLITKAKEIEMLDSLVKDQIEAELAEHCQVATYESGVLTLITFSNAWATQLRFHVPHIRDTLRKDIRWSALGRINIKIDPKATPKTTSDSPPTCQIQKETLPKGVAQQLMSLAESLPQKPGSDALKQALIRLAKHGEK